MPSVYAVTLVPKEKRQIQHKASELFFLYTSSRRSRPPFLNENAVFLRKTTISFNRKLKNHISMSDHRLSEAIMLTTLAIVGMLSMVAQASLSFFLFLIAMSGSLAFQEHRGEIGCSSDGVRKGEEKNSSRKNIPMALPHFFIPSRRTSSHRSLSRLATSAFLPRSADGPTPTRTPRSMLSAGHSARSPPTLSTPRARLPRGSYCTKKKPRR